MTLHIHMKVMLWGISAFVCCFSAFGQTPEIVIQTSSRPARFVAVVVIPQTNGWVALETSTNLSTWHPMANLLTTNRSGPFVDYSTSNAFCRFYRVRSPGVTAAEALSSWEAGKPNHYQYVFQNSKLDAGGVVLAGTVTISNGVKVVTNVTRNGFPTNSFDPADFLAPDEVFGVIADAEAHGAKLAHVSYNDQWHLPSAVVILRGPATAIVDYQISEFTALVTGGGQRRILHEISIP